jgi:hypothetical protein
MNILCALRLHFWTTDDKYGVARTQRCRRCGRRRGRDLFRGRWRPIRCEHGRHDYHLMCVRDDGNIHIDANVCHWCGVQEDALVKSAEATTAATSTAVGQMTSRDMKHEATATELAEALVTEFIETATFDAAKTFGLNSATVTRFQEKAYQYRIASVLIALMREEQRDPKFIAVRTQFERRIFPATPDEGVLLLDRIRSAMDDLSALLFPSGQPREMSWARNWLLDIGINVSNPVSFVLFAMYWVNYQVTASKALQSFRPVS